MIRGNTVGTTMPRSDWNQSDPKMPDYIKGKEAVDEAILKAQSTADSALAAAGKAQSTADGKVAKTEASATLASGKWADKKQTVNVSGVTKDNTVIVGPSTDSHVAYCEAVIRYYEQGEGTITFICEDVPSVDITLNVLILDEDASGGPGSSGNGESGVLFVTVDPGTGTASHSPAEILAAAKSGKTVQLYDPSENGAVVLPLFLATQNEAVFSATGYGGYDRGYYTRTYEAFVRSDRTVDFANDGFFDSRCVPDFEAEDAGKVLTVSENGLQWVEPPESGGTPSLPNNDSVGIPTITLPTLGFTPQAVNADMQYVVINEETYRSISNAMSTGFVTLSGSILVENTETIFVVGLSCSGVMHPNDREPYFFQGRYSDNDVVYTLSLDTNDPANPTEYAIGFRVCTQQENGGWDGTLTDGTTGKKYSLHVDNGKLMMEEV